MNSIVELDPDVAASVELLGRQAGRDPRELINAILRNALPPVSTNSTRGSYETSTADLGPCVLHDVDLASTGRVLAHLDQVEHLAKRT